MAQVEAVLRVYGGMKECGTTADMTTYGILLCAVGRAGMAVKAMQLWAEMVQQGTKPNKEAYNGIIHALAGGNNLEMGISFFKRMAEEGVSPDFQLCQAISKLLCKAGQAARTLELAQFIENKSIKMDIYESFIKALGNAGYAQEVRTLVKGLKADNMVPTEATYLCMIDGLCSTTVELNEIMTAMEEMEKDCGNSSIESYNSIVTSLCRTDQFQLAYYVLKQCHGRGLSPDTELFNTVFVGLSQQGNLQLAEGIFDELNMMGSKVKVTTFNAMLRSSAQAGDIETTKKVLRIMEAKAVSPNVDTYNAALTCFSRAGRLNVALQVFNEMRLNGCAPNTSSYNIVLLVLRKAGLTDAVSSFFERMKADGIMPDASTFNILSGFDENCANLSRAYVQNAALA